MKSKSKKLKNYYKHFKEFEPLTDEQMDYLLGYKKPKYTIDFSKPVARSEGKSFHK